MKNQFFYTRTEGEKSFRDSLNIEKVVRTVGMEDGRLLVLLDDIHERAVEMPQVNPKTNKLIGYKRQRDTYQSEIYLSGDDIQRFVDATSVN